jgi:uncharacterized low-complexity protein
MKKTTQLALAVGSAIAASAALTPAVRAADNPFGLTALSAGYQLADADTKMKDGKCGEAKCGADKAKMKEAKCGADKAKDGKCGADKGKMKEAKCGADKMKDGKCGADKKM